MALVEVEREGLLVDGSSLAIEDLETRQGGSGVGGGRGTMGIVEEQFIVQDDGELLSVKGEWALSGDIVDDAGLSLRA